MRQMIQDAWFDVSAGVAGDMVLGALIDAGANLDVVQAAVDLVIPGAVTLKRSSVTRAGMRATKIDVDLTDGDQPHRSFSTIHRLIEQAGLVDDVVHRAQKVFLHLAEAEGRVHAVPTGDVVFHEVGALDSIADIVGTCAALQDLGITHLSAGEMALGSGYVRSSHGIIPVPVPAVLEMSRRWRVLGGGAGELATPTGVALITALAEFCEELPAIFVNAVGTGAGTRDMLGRANVVRAVVGSTEDDSNTDLFETNEFVLECNVDDLDPRIWPGVLTDLLASGASDAWLVPIVMKKGRPAHTLCVLVAPKHVVVVRDMMFKATSTIGVRQTVVKKSALSRAWIKVPVGLSTVRIKVAHRDGIIVHATPEFEDVAILAEKESRPVRVLLEQAIVASVEAGLVTDAPMPSGGDTVKG